MGTHITGASNAGNMKKLRFSTNISLYLRSNKRQSQLLWKANRKPYSGFRVTSSDLAKYSVTQSTARSLWQLRFLNSCCSTGMLMNSILGKYLTEVKSISLLQFAGASYITSGLCIGPQLNWPQHWTVMLNPEGCRCLCFNVWIISVSASLWMNSTFA